MQFPITLWTCKERIWLVTFPAHIETYRGRSLRAATIKRMTANHTSRNECLELLASRSSIIRAMNC